MRTVSFGYAAMLVCIASSTSASAPFTRYTVDTETGIVRDNKTGLFWQREIVPGALNWTEASAYCSGLRLDGRGWRLPRVKELLTLIDPSMGSVLIDSTIFPNTPAERFWAFTSHAVATDRHWTVDFGDGGSRDQDPPDMLRVRCVQQ